MRSLTAVVLAGSLFASSAYAGSTDAALTPGKPAGVKNADLAGNTGLMLIGLAIVAGGIALVCSEGSGNNIAATTTTNKVTTSTTTTKAVTTTTTA